MSFWHILTNISAMGTANTGCVPKEAEMYK